MTNKVLQQHINHLANELGGVTIEHRGPFVGMMFVEETPPRIQYPDITCAREYYIGLHELGHVALGHTQGRPPNTEKKFYFENGVLRSEAQAWEWAFDHALVPMSEEEGQYCHQNYLGSYVRAAQDVGPYNEAWHWGRPEGPDRSNGDRHYVKFAYGPVDTYVKSVMDRLWRP